MGLSNEQIARYSRHLLLPGVGVRGQKKLLSSKVLIVGAGGLGSPAAMYLAAAGVGTIGLADADSVELTNLQRQIIHGSADVGKTKVESARETLHALNPDVQLITHPTFVTAQNVLSIIQDYDFILECTDNFPAKFLLNDACVLAKKPFSHAGILRFTGEMLTYVPGKGPCYRCVFKEPPPSDLVPSCAAAGVIGGVAGVIGSMQALEAIKYLLNLGELFTGKLFHYNALTLEFNTIQLSRADPECAVCGKHPSIHAPQDIQGTVCEAPRH